MTDAVKARAVKAGAVKAGAVKAGAVKAGTAKAAAIATDAIATSAVTPDTAASRKARPRGRPRNPAARQAILRAARDLLAGGGLGAVTMEAVAARAGVGKPTVYRWWPDRHAVAMAALMEAPADRSRPARPRAPLVALRRQLEAVAAAFATPTGRTMASMLAAASAETELAKAFRNHFVLARREEGRRLLAEAREARAIRADADIETMADAIYGALFFRLLLGHAPLDARFVRRLLDGVQRGLGAGVTAGAGRHRAGR